MNLDDLDLSQITELLEKHPNGLTSDQLWEHTLYHTRQVQSQAIGRLVRIGTIYLDGTAYHMTQTSSIPHKRNAMQERLHQAMLDKISEPIVETPTTYNIPPRKVTVVAKAVAPKPTKTVAPKSDSDKKVGNGVKMGTVRRNCVTGVVLLFMWYNRRTYLSIDIVAKNSGVSREDVSRVLSQECPKGRYIAKFGNGLRSTYTWNIEYFYPHSSVLDEDTVLLRKFDEAKSRSECRTVFAQNLVEEKVVTEEENPVVEPTSEMVSPIVELPDSAYELLTTLRSLISGFKCSTFEVLGVLSVLSAEHNKKLL